MQQLQTDTGMKLNGSISPDGSQFAFHGQADTGSWSQNSDLFIVPLNGGTSINLSASSDFHCETSTITDMGQPLGAFSVNSAATLVEGLEVVALDAVNLSEPSVAVMSIVAMAPAATEATSHTPVPLL